MRDSDIVKGRDWMIYSRLVEMYQTHILDMSQLAELLLNHFCLYSSFASAIYSDLFHVSVILHCY